MGLFRVGLGGLQSFEKCVLELLFSLASDLTIVFSFFQKSHWLPAASVSSVTEDVLMTQDRENQPFCKLHSVSVCVCQVVSVMSDPLRPQGL